MVVRKRWWGLLALALYLAMPGGLGSIAFAADEAAERAFALKVLPILKAKCLACHGDDPKELKGTLDLRSLDGMLKGGESGEPAIVPGNPEESLLYLSVNWEVLEMPPKRNDRLTSDQIELIRQWIAAGAPWPNESARQKYRQEEWNVEENADGVLVKTTRGLSDDWTHRRYRKEDLWAFQPVLTPQPTAERTVAGNPIDSFIDARLVKEGIKPAPEADPSTLIRRATLDLIGLPPSPEEITAFLGDWKIDPEPAWLRLVDRLLSSPHHGERWGQHWLDVARYADTGGYSNDYERSNAWRYRDYVIRSFNDDKPYDRFVIEQLAGDELADDSLLQRVGGDAKAFRKARSDGDYNAEEAEWLVATGFLRMGPWDNAMVKTEEARQIYLDDAVNAVGQTFLSTTLRCVKCHDHKFDPIPTRDYYRFYSALATTQMAERPVPFLPSENRDGFEEGKAFVETMLAFAVAEKNKLLAKQEAADRRWFQDHGLTYVPESARKDLPDEAKPPRYNGLDHVDEGTLKVREQDEWIWERSLERFKPMAQSVYAGPTVDYAWNGARKLRISEGNNPKKLPRGVILLGGSIEAPGEPVSPGVLSALHVSVPGASGEDPYTLPATPEGRRLGLARWIADPKNPLTSRSFVNRLWQHHFGQGLARDSNNFGVKGAKPTHPELLDWLSADFVANGWRVKRMHRLILTSRAYRRSSTHPEADPLQAKDPDNALLSKFSPRRLSAEELRDAMLAVSGEWNPALGGLPVMPEINMEVALQPRMIQFSLAPAYQPSPTPAQRNRRTINAYRVRGQADPFLELFNQPNPNESCAQRDTAAVAPQVLTLLNSDAVTDRSIAFAVSLRKARPDVAGQVEEAFRRALGRPPTGKEKERMVSYLAEMRAYHHEMTPKPIRYPTRITRSLVEEFSGRTFEYDEILPVFENYRPDRKAADVEPETRALADLCLLLFNSNEFLYVY